MSNILSYIKHLAGLVFLGLMLQLGGCGDVGSVQLADGIGGTGISMGRLTGFGSIYVNGVRFDTDNAEFIRDGETSSVQSDFNIGEIVRVFGTVNNDRKTGTATRVVYSDVLEGSVTQVADGRELRVMEQRVITDPLTVFHGFKELADLRLDNIVEVSGFTNAEGNVQATSIRLVNESFTVGDILELEGAVTQLNIDARTFNINDLTVNYAQAVLFDVTHAELRNGIYVSVATQQAVRDSTIIASEITKLDDAPEAGVGYEIEGLISYYLSPGYFEIDGFPIATNNQTVYENGGVADLEENSSLIIEGAANSQGIIVAESVTFLDFDSEVYLEATIEAIDLDSNSLSILGQTVSINAHTLLSDDTTEDFVMLELSQFVVGESVYIAAYENNEGHYIASRLSRISPIETLYLSGKPQSPDATQGQFSLFEKMVISDEFTLYLDEDLNELTRTEFFKRLVDEELEVDITGVEIGSGHLLAEAMVLFIE